MGNPLVFASLRQEQEWDAVPPRLHPRLVAIVLAAALFAFSEYGWIFCVTSILRTVKEDAELGGTGVHCLGRAIDIRTRGIAQEWVDSVTARVNGIWTYDPERPDKPVAYVKQHGTGPHLHLQVHPQTTKRIA